MLGFYNYRTKVETARVFTVFCRTNWSLYRNSVGIFAALDFQNLGSLAVGQTEVPRCIYLADRLQFTALPIVFYIVAQQLSEL